MYFQLYQLIFVCGYIHDPTTIHENTLSHGKITVSTVIACKVIKSYDVPWAVCCDESLLRILSSCQHALDEYLWMLIKESNP